MTEEPEMEKTVVTTMTDETSRKLVAATHTVLQLLRQIPGWGDRTNGIKLTGPSGEEIEVTAVTGGREAVQIVVLSRSES